MALKSHLCLLTLLHESILALLLLALLLPCEVGFTRDLVQSLGVDALQIDLGGSGNHVASVDPTQRHAVDLEGSRNKQSTLGELLEEDDTLASEAASKENEDGTGLERLAVLGWSDGLACL
jgi:hypothetical protein